MERIVRNGTKQKIVQYINGLSEKQMITIFICSSILMAVGHFMTIICSKAISVYIDELVYLQYARNLIHQGEFSVYNVSYSFQNWLYSVVIAPCFLVENSKLQIWLVLLINSILMTSTLIPVFILSRKILHSNLSILAVLLFCILLPEWNLSVLIVSENLFYPLALWTLLEVYNFIAETDIRKKSICSIKCAVLFFMCYATKAIALYFFCAFVGMLCLELLFNKDVRFREHIRYLFVAIFVFIVLYLLVFKCFFNSGMGYSGQVGNGMNLIQTREGVLFSGYAFLYNIISVLLSMSFFIIIIPLINIHSYESVTRKYLSFVMLSLLIAIATLTLLVSLPEDFGDSNVRSHMRYLSILVIPFVMCLLERKLTMTLKKRVVLGISVIGFVGLLLIMLRAPIKNTVMDSVSLGFFHDYVTSGDVVVLGHYLSAEESLLLFKALVIAVVLSISLVFLVCKKDSSIGVVICFVLACLISVANDCSSIRWLKMETDVNTTMVAEAVQLNDKLSELDGNILYINSGIINRRVFDTYVTNATYVIDSSNLLSDSEEKYEKLDLHASKLNSLFLNVEYTDLDSINYVITTDKSEFDMIDNYRIIDYYDEESQYYFLYENLTPSIIQFENRNIFPRLKGETIVTDSEETVFYTNHIVNDEGEYASINSKGALIYGPGCEITKGRYSMLIEYDYYGDLEDGIARYEVSLNSLGEIVAQGVLMAKQEQISIDDICVSQDCSVTEIRVFPADADVVIKRIIISKIE